MTDKIKILSILLVLFIIAPLWVHASDTPSVECTRAYVLDKSGNDVSFTSDGEYRGVAEVTAAKECNVICALAVFEAYTHDLKDVAYEIKKVTEGKNSLYTSYLSCNDTCYVRFFVWQENLGAICPDYLVSPKSQYGSIASATLTAKGKNYKGFINPHNKTIMFDVGSLSEDYLSDVTLFFETDDSVFPDANKYTFDLTKNVKFTVCGSNGEPISYTVEAFNSEIRRMYNCEGAKIITSDGASSMWGGSYRVGAPGWISSETSGGGAWFVDSDGSKSASISVKTENTNDYLHLSKTMADGSFTLWSGDNKVLPTLNKIHASVKFKADTFSQNDFASFDVGATDKIHLSAAEGGYVIACKDTEGYIKPLELSPLLEPGRWYTLDFMFVRSFLTSTNDSGLYNGYGVYVYLNGSYIGKTSGVSLYPADYTGYITMNSFSDSTYSVFRVSLSEGSVSEFSIDDIYVTASYGTDNTDSSKCALDQRVFLASYFAGKNSKYN